jgi:Holliday junction resolvase RusA-like endonuclease
MTKVYGGGLAGGYAIDTDIGEPAPARYMGTSWTCVIPGKPKPKGNATRVMRLGRFTKVMPSDATVEAQNTGKAWAISQKPDQMLSTKDEPVALCADVDFVFAIPATRRKGKHALKPGDPHIQAPDRGNLLKMLEDVLEMVAYANDCVIADGRVRKTWGATDETRVTLRAIV